MIIHGFDLTEGRVTALQAAGISSIRDLYKVLAALDLGCRVELKELAGLAVSEGAPRVPAQFDRPVPAQES